MDLSTSLGLLAVVLLVLANGLFVATEFAIVGVRKSRLEQLAREGNDNARAAQRIVGHLDTYIAARQLGITMASLAPGGRLVATRGRPSIGAVPETSSSAWRTPRATQAADD